MNVRTLTCGAFVLVLLCSAASASERPGMVALVTCQPSCSDDSSAVYVGCDNGTVTDNRSGLVWLANASCFGEMEWHEAMAAVAGLGDLDCASLGVEGCDCDLSDHSSPGDWRLPSLSEWQTMVARLQDVDVCNPTILTDAGNSCWNQGCFEAALCSFADVQSSTYWSSSSHAADPDLVWLIDLARGVPDLLAKDSAAFIWPVRYGQ